MTPKPRQPLRRISRKKLASLGGISPRSTVTGPRKAVKKVNAKRRKSEFARAYHSAARVEWVKRQPCVVSGCSTAPAERGIRALTVENVHVKGGGAGRKADYRWVVPMEASLHRKLHRIGIRSFEQRYDVDLELEADRTHSRWENFAERASPDSPLG